MSTLVHYVTCN